MDNENLERGWPTPRSWEKVSHVITMMEETGAPEKFIKKAIYGLVGNAAGVEFINFYKNKTIFDDVFAAMVDPSIDYEIPDGVDKQYAVVSAIVYYLWKGKDEKDEANRLNGFFKIAMKLPSNFSTMAVVDAMSVDSEHKQISKNYSKILLSHPMYLKWSAKHGSAMKKRIKVN